jgi:hypothetical protein
VRDVPATSPVKRRTDIVDNSTECSTLVLYRRCYG